VDEEGKEKVLLFRVLEVTRAPRDLSGPPPPPAPAPTRARGWPPPSLSQDGALEPLKPLREVSITGSGDVEIRWAYDGSAFLMLTTVLFDANNVAARPPAGRAHVRAGRRPL